MTQPPDPNTGESFATVEVGSEDYYDASAVDPGFPGSIGLQMRKHTWWQGNVQWDTYEAIGTTNLTYTDFGSVSLNDPSRGPGTASGDDPGQFVVIRPPFIPLIGQSEHNIVIELHGAYGFPDGICRFPVTPEGPGPDFPSNTHWYPEMIGFGEIVVPGYEKLETIGWQSFWPNADGYDDSYVCISQDQLTVQGDPHDQFGPIANLIWIKRWAKVCRLVVGNSLFNDDVIITDFGYSDEFGDPNSVKYKITFKRFRTTSISSVSNPDADVDHFSTIPSNNTTTPSDTTIPVDPSGDGTTPIVLVNPDRADGTAPPITPASVFTDEGTARAAQTSGLVQNPIVQFIVLPLTDSRTKGGGGILHVFDGNKGETLNDVAWRAGVKWDGVQIDLNPQYKYTSPDTVNLSPGATLNLALGHPSIEATPNNPFNAPSQLIDRGYFDPNSP